MISSYCSTDTSVSDISGLNFLSLISTLLLDFLSIQFKSAFEYGCLGMISYISASAADAIISATFFVVPLALKNATNLFPIGNPPYLQTKMCKVFFIHTLHIYYNLHYYIMSNTYFKSFTMP